MTPDRTITLFHSPQTRSSGALTLLEELSAPYELKVLNMKAGEQRQPAYLAVNPLGKVPAILDGDALVTEQVAIFIHPRPPRSHQKSLSGSDAPCARTSPPARSRSAKPICAWSLTASRSATTPSASSATLEQVVAGKASGVAGVRSSIRKWRTRQNSNL